MAQIEVYQPDTIARCATELQRQFRLRPGFLDLIEDLDTHVCSRQDLLAAIEVAPTPALRMYLYGQYQFREMLALAIGVKF